MSEKVVHYGLWHSEIGWWYQQDRIVWTTTSHVVALAQCSMVRENFHLSGHKPDYKVRPLLDWQIKLTREQFESLEWQDD